MAKTKVLIVEDEWIVADALQQRLEELGYEAPQVVSTGKDAVEKAQEMKPDVVLMDIMLHGQMDGIEAANKIHTYSSVPVIYLTAFANKKILKRAKATAPYAYIIKPVKKRELHSTIEMALYKHEAEKMLRMQNRELETMYEASSAISSSLSLNAVLNTVAQQMMRVLDYTGCGLFLWNPKDKTLETLLDYSVDKNANNDPAGTVYDLRKYRTRDRVLNTAQTFVIQHQNGRSDKAELAFMKTRGIQRALLLPLMVGEQVLGLVSLMDSEQKREYWEDEIRLAESLAAHAAVAVQNAELYVEAQQEIAKRKKAESELIGSEKKYRDLSEELATANNLKDILLDVVTHDLRNPVNIIKGMTGLIKDKYGDDERLEAIRKSSNHLVMVLQETTDLSNAILGDEISMERLDLEEVIGDVLRELEEVLKDARVKIEMEVQIRLFVKANSIIRRVLRNFISNVIEHASAGKRAVIGARKEGRYVVISVKDFGKTIPELECSRIFERSIQLDSEIGSGRGLGLAIAKRIAEAHKGKVWVEPNNPTGNIFYLKVPQ